MKKLAIIKIDTHLSRSTREEIEKYYNEMFSETEYKFLVQTKDFEINFIEKEIEYVKLPVTYPDPQITWFYDTTGIDFSEHITVSNDGEHFKV